MKINYAKLLSFLTLCSLLLLISCGGGGGGASDSGNATKLVATKIVNTVPAGTCANGGITVNGGIDSNGNKVLDDNEITSTQYVCNGSDGTNGTNGSNGSNGLTTLVLISNEAAGPNCADGGNKVDAGQDANGNSVLDTSEVTSTAYICNGSNGSNGTNGTNGSNGLQSLVSVVPEPAGSSCASGGSKISSGLDANNNGVLDPMEVTSTQYVCNGINGTNGTNGNNGIDTLVKVTAEPPGINCATGGNKLETGQDTNSNTVLDASEVSTTAYVCNGTNGTNGTNGSNGLNSLVSIVPEPAGQYCTYGGNKVSSGLDNNPTNGVLNSAEITSSSYVCNGAPGATGPAGPGITWVNVTGAAVQAVSNTGYLANKSTQVTITLPTAPVLGDIVSVSGIGAGGWNVAQNAGQTIITKDLPGGIGKLWLTHDSARYWDAVASSADGSKLVAAEYSGYLYTSADAGVTWWPRGRLGKLTLISENWMSVASSSDGTKVVAVSDGGQIYTSTDSGVNWSMRDSARSWYGVASSADGTKLVATVYGGQIYTSTDSGVTWIPRDSARWWRYVASSADGTKLVATVYSGQIYTSTDSGATWIPHAKNGYWQGVASSADGTKLVAADYGGQIYTSTSSGTLTWSAHESARNWMGVASSADGTRLFATEYGGNIYISTDSGVTWAPRDPSISWYAVASSSDGTKLVAANRGGYLYTSSANTTPGTTGWISGGQYDAIELQYVGNNTFSVLSHEGTLVIN